MEEGQPVRRTIAFVALRQGAADVQRAARRVKVELDLVAIRFDAFIFNAPLHHRGGVHTRGGYALPGAVPESVHSTSAVKWCTGVVVEGFVSK